MKKSQLKKIIKEVVEELMLEKRHPKVEAYLDAGDELRDALRGKNTNLIKTKYDKLQSLGNIMMSDSNISDDETGDALSIYDYEELKYDVKDRIDYILDSTSS